MKNNVAATLLNWNGADEAAAGVRSLQACDRPPAWIVVVDNGSGPESLASVKQIQGIHLVRLDRNRGCSGGVNAGMQEAWQLGASHAWLVNCDVRVAPDCLGELLRQAAALGAPALLSPVIHFLEQPDRAQHHVSFIDMQSGAVYELRDASEVSAIQRPGRLTLLWGTALLIPREVARAIGDFDEVMFAYGEDSDYCLRAHREGIAVQVVPAARVWHGNPVSGPRRPHYYYYTTRNPLHFNRRHFGARLRLMLLYWHFLRLRGTRVKLEGLAEQRAALAAGLWHGLLGRGGAYDARFRAPRVIAWLLQRQ